MFNKYCKKPIRHNEPNVDILNIHFKIAVLF